ncbi:MAG: hypothetical protein RLZ44_599 [Pseudomonadota bacterium]
MRKLDTLLPAFASCLFAPLLWANVDRELPLPPAEPSAEEVARQVYYANHFYAFKNFSIEHRGRTSAVLINRTADGATSTVAVERHLNNAYASDTIKSRDLAIFRSGNLQGTGMLVTDFVDDDLSQSYMLWLPALRKIRRFAEPEHDQAWGGSVFTFGDVTLRKPQHEHHELLGKKPLRTCLGVMQGLEGEAFRFVGNLPKRSCRHVNKEVYGLKSTTKFKEWWYDYRISLVDTKSFADYRTLYYKDGRLIKIIDRDWGVVDEADVADPRALFWKSWYGLDLVSGNESWAVIPQSVIRINTDQDSDFWSEKTLRKIKR